MLCFRTFLLFLLFAIVHCQQVCQNIQPNTLPTSLRQICSALHASLFAPPPLPSSCWRSIALIYHDKCKHVCWLSVSGRSSHGRDARIPKCSQPTATDHLGGKICRRGWRMRAAKTRIPDLVRIVYFCVCCLPPSANPEFEFLYKTVRETK